MLAVSLWNGCWWPHGSGSLSPALVLGSGSPGHVGCVAVLPHPPPACSVEAAADMWVSQTCPEADNEHKSRGPPTNDSWVSRVRNSI